VNWFEIALVLAICSQIGAGGGLGGGAGGGLGGGAGGASGSGPVGPQDRGPSGPGDQGPSDPGIQLVPASGIRAIAAASSVSATRSSGSRLCRCDLPQARASVCASSTIVRR
jgi:hypothetical protein